MPIIAYKCNVIAVCDYLVEQGYTDRNHTTDFSNVPGMFVDPIMKWIMTSEGIIRKYDSLYYVDVTQYAEWRSGLHGPFGLW